MFAIHRLSARVLLSQITLALVALFAPKAAFAVPGDLYVTDLASGSVFRYEADGTAHTFATGFTNPQGITFDEGNAMHVSYIYVADAGDGGAGNGIIMRYDLAGNGILFASGLDNPIGLGIDGNDLLVAENGADRVTSLPLNGDPATIFRVLNSPVGLDSRNISGSGFTAYLANGVSVLKVAASQSDIDIDPNDGSRSAAATLGGNVFVTTDAGTITKVFADGSPSIEFASGFVDPHGLDLQPNGAPGGGDTGFVFVADTGAHSIVKVANDGTKSDFVTGAGDPNYLVFETGSGEPTPTPTPTPTITPTPTPTPTPPVGRALNISTRVDVETDDNVGIGGFIISGTDPKLVVIRAIGPSLSDLGISNPLSDPLLELHDESGILTTNDNWMDNTPENQMVLTDNNLAPSDDLEAAIVMTLNPGQYTAIIKGSNGATGVALVEVYDLDDPSTESELLNISTRGLVGTGENVLIAGVIVGPTGGADASVVVRAIGPSLPVANPLIDPVLELHNSDGDKIATNDNWETDPPLDNYSAEVIAAMLEPPSAADSAIFANLVAGSYTAIVTGKDGTGGVALVEVYHVPAQMTQSSSP